MDGLPVEERRARKMELYAEHLLAVSDEFRARGIRPGIWCDMILKALQYPLWEFAAKRYLRPGADEERDFSDCIARQFGPVRPECLRTLTEWNPEFPAFDGRFWQPPMKCSLPAPPGQLKKVKEVTRVIWSVLSR